MLGRRWIACFAFAAISVSVQAVEVRGYTEWEVRHFPKEGLRPEQLDTDGSLALNLELFQQWDEGRQNFLISPFLRVDKNDEQRTHGDFRELAWSYTSADWELTVGLRKFFWGVVESYHLVDIINQRDLVEDPDGDATLGQPVIGVSLFRDFGNVSLYGMPYFRERTFAGREGRLNGVPLPVAENEAQYESGEREHHFDWAARWRHTMGDFDVGVAYFDGTDRTPLFVPVVDDTGGVELAPLYNLLRRLSTDVQWTMDPWLWKLELARGRTREGDYAACVAGLEYTMAGIFQTQTDLGLLLEYLYDDRGKSAAATGPFDNDIFVGLRWVGNDVASTEVVLGSVVDLEQGGNSVRLEANRRLGSNWKLRLEARVYDGKEIDDPLYWLNQDDHVRLVLARYF